MNHIPDRQVLQEAIDALPDFCRQVFTLRRFHHLSHREIARRLGVSEETVNAQLVLAMNHCRQHLRASHYAPAGAPR